MSNDGKVSVRAPAMPSMVNRPCAASNWPMFATVTIARGRSNVAPPLNDRVWKKTPCRVLMSVPTQTTYTTPWLSVRTAQPCRPPVWLLLVAALSWLVRQVSPPSVDRANSTGSGAPP